MSSNRSELQKLLYRLVQPLDVQFRFNTTVVAIDPDTPSVTFKSGEQLSVDIVVGADSADGLVRKVVVGNKEPSQAADVVLYKYAASLCHHLAP